MTPERAAAGHVRWLVFPDTVSIGGAEAVGPEAIGSIGAAALLSGRDRFVVADGQTQALHLFELDGSHVRLIGGRGGGPGEHRNIGSVRGTDDGGFCTWDVQAARATRFGPDGSAASTGLADLDGLESIRPSFQGFFGDCRFVLRDQPSTMEMREVPEGLRQDTIRFVLFEPDGRQVRVLASVPDAEHWFKNRDENWGQVQLIFGEQLFGFPQGEEFWFGISDELLWTRLDLEGTNVGRRGLERPRRPVSEAQVEEERERRIGEVRVPRVDLPIGPPGFLGRMEESQRAGLRVVPARSWVPAYDIVVPGLSGGLWSREHPIPSDSVSTWTFLDAFGEEVGSTSLPRDAQILSGSEDLILVGTADELGAPVLLVLSRVS